MFRRLYDWVIALAGHRHALPAMGAVSFLESSVFPIPPDVMLVPMVLANRRRAFQIALVCTVTSVLGGMLGYAIGYYLFETLGAWVVRVYGLEAARDSFVAGFESYGTWIILIKGLTPIPYKLVTITSGFAGYNFFLFVVLSLITRGMRFYALAFLLNRYGDQARAIIEERLTFWATSFAVVLVAGIIAAVYLF
jgi:membrane protein YqaA with SNARE-associated domain